MLRLIVAAQTALHSWLAGIWRRLCRAAAVDTGQATAEYALVLLGAAAVALLLVGWAARSGKVTQLLDGVIDKILEQI